ncbi:MAG: hypothetical protein D6795_09350 [Deltaproteobacteria bacterium]|nr:MAG: hypothetical protein D6795_09350 [Deltaproteobacteria bacterium]
MGASLHDGRMTMDGRTEGGSNSLATYGSGKERSDLEPTRGSDGDVLRSGKFPDPVRKIRTGKSRIECFRLEEGLYLTF